MVLKCSTFNDSCFTKVKINLEVCLRNNVLSKKLFSVENAYFIEDFNFSVDSVKVVAFKNRVN